MSLSHCTRDADLSVTLKTADAKNLFYISPGEHKEAELQLSNTGALNDSYWLMLDAGGDCWSYRMSHSRTPQVIHGNSFAATLNVTAPRDLFRHSKECVFDLVAVSMSNASIRSNISLVFILSPIDIEMDFSVADPSGDIIEETETDVEEDRDSLLYMTVSNDGNVDDVYSITLSGLSQGWSASFIDGRKELTVEIGPVASRSSETQAIIVRCKANATDGSPLVIQCNSTLSEELQRPLVYKVSTLNLRKIFDINPIIIESDVKFLTVEPGENISIMLSVTNFGSNEVSFKPELEETLPEWIELLEFPTSHIWIGAGETEAFALSASVEDRAPADSEFFLGISGRCRESHGQVFDDWVRVSVDHVYDLAVDINRTKLEMEPTDRASLTLTLFNRGNGMEEIDIYPHPNGPIELNLSERTFVLPAFSSMNVTLELGFGDPENASSLDIRISVVSLRENNRLDINITVKREIPPPSIDLAFEDQDIVPGGGSGTGNGYIYVNFTVLNAGNGPTGPFTITIATRNRLGSIAQLIMEKEERELFPGEKRFFSVPFIPKEADQKLVVELDSHHSVDEVIEGNNILDVSLDPYNNREGTIGNIPTGKDPTLPVPLFVGGGGILVAMLVISGIFAFGGESTRYSMLGLSAPLYTKLVRKDILSHKTRERVYKYVKNNPGSHYRFILDELDLKNGTLTYHLKTLEKREFIVSKKDGPYRRFFPRGSSDKEKIFIHGFRKDIYQFIHENPGLSQKEIAKLLKKATPTVHYHINNLVNEGLVELRRNGRETLCFAMNSHNVQ